MQCTNPVTLFPKRNQFGRWTLDPVKFKQGLLVPCGKCLSCRIKRTEEWTMRVLHELSFFDDAAFITLTYNEESINTARSLIKKDLQLYFKRLRKQLGDKKIKYMACGEYGDITERPHYHAIILGLSPLYDSKLIKDCWSYGNVFIGSCTPDSIRYVSKYVQKQWSGEKAQKEYQEKNRERPFKIQSIGIGERYCKRIASQIKLTGSLTMKGVKMSVPRYYLEKLGLSDDMEFMERMRIQSMRSEAVKIDKAIGQELTESDAYINLNVSEFKELNEKINDDRHQRSKNVQARSDIKQLRKKSNL